MTTDKYETYPDPFAPTDEAADANLEADAETEYGLLMALVQARKTLKLHQDDIAEILGVSQSVVSDLERGKTELKVNTVLEYARAVGQELSIRLNNRDVRRALTSNTLHGALKGTIHAEVTPISAHSKWNHVQSQPLIWEQDHHLIAGVQ
ncbi:helix-turn-helix domain-containing protein [Kocuria carniphila]|uniref:helix-turn-helix domain-containing protein n=1 Tax=Kocuria carniphila TaxID=262208 RepID=UPI0034CF4062